MSLKPRLNYFDVTMLLISLVVGIGIFRTPSDVAKAAGTPMIFYGSWVLGGIISICGALTFAEIGSRYPVAGGQYKLFSHCFHPAYAFMLNWVLIIINAASTAAVAMIGAEYINPLILPASLQNDTGILITVMSLISILFVINLLGVKMGARVSNVLTIFKIVMISLFSASVFFIAGKTAAPVAAATGPDWTANLQGLGMALIPVLFTYGGYQQTLNFGGDILNPKRNLPRAIVTGIAIIVVLYLAINVAYVNVLGFKEVQESKLLAADLTRAFFGEKGAIIISIVIFLSVCGFVNAIYLSNPRMYYAMVEDRVLPGIFKKLNEKTQVQEFALTFFFGLVIASFFLLKTFSNIINYVMFIDCIWLASAGAAIFILRSKAKKEAPYDGFRIRLFPVVPIIFIIAMLFVSISVLIHYTEFALYGLALLAAGAPIYIVMRMINKKKESSGS